MGALTVTLKIAAVPLEAGERGLHAQLLLAYIRYIQNLSQTINLDYLAG